MREIRDYTSLVLFASRASLTTVIIFRSGLKRGVYVHLEAVGEAEAAGEAEAGLDNLKFKLDTKCSTKKPFVVKCTPQSIYSFAK